MQSGLVPNACSNLCDNLPGQLCECLVWIMTHRVEQKDISEMDIFFSLRDPACSLLRVLNMDLSLASVLCPCMLRSIVSLAR